MKAKDPKVFINGEEVHVAPANFTYNRPTEETMAEEKSITITKAQVAQIFNEWADAYKADPNEYQDFFNSEKNPIPDPDYGTGCADELFKRHAELIE